jgi:hypothetical protein
MWKSVRRADVTFSRLVRGPGTVNLMDASTPSQPAEAIGEIARLLVEHAEDALTSEDRQ